MSFDIFVQGFEAGGAAPLDGLVITELLGAHAIYAGDALVGLRFPDGEAEVYGGTDVSDSFMVTNASGRAVWDLLAALVTTGGATLLIPGCPTIVGSDAALAELPDEIRDEAIVATTGDAILAAVEAE